MANINKIKLSGTTYNIQDSNAALVSDVFITAQNRNSIQSVIKEGVYSLSTDDVYSITGTKANSTDRIKGLIIVDNTSYNFTGSTSSDVEGVSALVGIVTFDLSSNFSISLVDRDTNHINELFIESFTSDGEESPMTNITITHNPSVGVNKIDYVATLYTEFVHEKYALSEELSGKQDTLIAGSGITISGNVISATGGGSGATVIEVTQAQYDALVEAGTLDLTALYIITDAQSLDIRDYWTSAQTESAISQATSGKANSSDVYLKTETSGATEISTALGNKQDTLVSGSNIKTINSQSILGEGNITIEGGAGGKAIEAGRGISITTGETADTVSFNLPISAGTNALGVVNNALKMGENTTAAAVCSFAMGSNTLADGYRSFAGGGSSRARAESTFAYGTYVDSLQFNETAFGKYNVSNKANSTWGDSGNTLFSVGNGEYNARHNAFEIRQNGDIYCSDGTNDVKLQDTITATAANTTALGGLSIVKLTESEYTALVTKDSNTLYVVVPDPSN